MAGFRSQRSVAISLTCLSMGKNSADSRGRTAMRLKLLITGRFEYG